MRSLLPILIAILVSITLSGCAEMYSAMSNYNAANGSKCKVKAASFAGYHEGEGKYMENRVLYKESTTDQNIKNEYAWLKKKMNEYVYKNGFGTFYETSPFTDISYKFHTYCKDYY
ncbi:hypothetical protein [Gramella sp. KN1008]|uniref:hypothetical protein n=1 Tax=Gramella sp. KN1008 TaxID=2529298 RepID=UPI00103E764C|nr:hypothetical protein [Gramella sp. KN1008]TBW28249.1 hypothetical protein EZJ28_05750 [Gramella sp. KN1008]